MIEPGKQIAARVAGFLYLLTNATAIFGFYARSQAIAPTPVETAKRLAASETLIRIGLATEVITVAGVLALVVALYMILEPINRPLALVATLCRILENVVLALIPMNSLIALALVSGAPYLTSVETAELQALAHLFLRIHLTGFRIGFFFLGLGSAVFGYLWLKSRYIPRALSWLGIIGSLLMAIAEVTFIAFPALARSVGMLYMAPMGVFEITMGFWLLIRGIRSNGESAPSGTDRQQLSRA